MQVGMKNVLQYYVQYKYVSKDECITFYSILYRNKEINKIHNFFKHCLCVGILKFYVEHDSNCWKKSTLVNFLYKSICNISCRIDEYNVL